MGYFSGFGVGGARGGRGGDSDGGMAGMARVGRRRIFGFGGKAVDKAGEVCHDVLHTPPIGSAVGSRPPPVGRDRPDRARPPKPGGLCL